MSKNVEILNFLLVFADKSPKWPPQLVPGTKWEQYDDPDHPTPQWALPLSTVPVPPDETPTPCMFPCDPSTLSDLFYYFIIEFFGLLLFI